VGVRSKLWLPISVFLTMPRAWPKQGHNGRRREVRLSWAQQLWLGARRDRQPNTPVFEFGRTTCIRNLWADRLECARKQTIPNPLRRLLIENPIRCRVIVIRAGIEFDRNAVAFAHG
jgi:hypothetical protein